MADLYGLDTDVADFLEEFGEPFRRKSDDTIIQAIANENPASVEQTFGKGYQETYDIRGRSCKLTVGPETVLVEGEIYICEATGEKWQINNVPELRPGGTVLLRIALANIAPM